VIRPAEALVGLAAAGLLAAMSALDWYGSRSAWAAFAVLDVVLLAVALLGLALVLLTATRRSPALPVTLALVLVPLTLVATAWVAYRLADPPGDGAVRAGAWVGLGCVALLLVGVWLSLRDERAPRRFAAVPEVPVRPAPPAS